MSAVSKNRLVGSIILIIAAVVFIPDLLDGQKTVVKDDFKVIPQRPEFAAITPEPVVATDLHQAQREAALALPKEDVAEFQPEPTPESVTVAETLQSVPETMVAEATPIQETTLAAEASAPAPVKPIEKKAEAEVKKTPLTDAAWVVRVGSFSKAQNAEALVNRLKDAGFASYTRKIVNAQGQPMVSVVVGPELQKNKLEANLAKLEQIAQVKNLRITSFAPIENN